MLLLSRFALFLTATEGDIQEGGNGILQMLMSLIWIVPLIAIFYFLMIRPESKRKKAAAKMRDELIVGDEVTTIGGIVGKVVSIKDDTVTIESGPERARVKIMRWAISTKGQQVTDK